MPINDPLKQQDSNVIRDPLKEEVAAKDVAQPQENQYKPIAGIPTDPTWGSNFMKSLSIGAGRGLNNLLKGTNIEGLKLPNGEPVGPIVDYNSIQAPQPGVASAADIITPFLMPMGEAGIAAKAIPTQSWNLLKTVGSKVAAPIMPKTFGEKMLGNLSDGKNLTENGQALAKDIYNAFDRNFTSGQNLYAPIDAIAKDSNLKIKATKLAENYADNKGMFTDDFLNTIKKNKKIETLFNQYVNDNSYPNAQKLQSQLGSKIREMEAANTKKQLSQHDVDLMERYSDIRSTVKNDIRNSLGQLNENLPKIYDKATDFWDKNVATYYENPKILAIVRGKITDPRSIPTIFKNPEEAIQKVVSDIGQKGRDRILFSELGKYDTPEGLTNAISKLDEKGLTHYASDNFMKQATSLAQKIKNKQIAQMVGGMGAASAGIGAGFSYLKNHLNTLTGGE